MDSEGGPGASIPTIPLHLGSRLISFTLPTGCVLCVETRVLPLWDVHFEVLSLPKPTMSVVGHRSLSQDSNLW